MPTPPPYTRRFDFTDWSASHPVDPPPGSALDAEFNALAQVVNAQVARSRLVQASDGTLAPGSVTLDSLDRNARIAIGSGFFPRGEWAEDTNYGAADLVSKQGLIYLALWDHTSDEFPLDLAEGLWMLFVQPVATARAQPVQAVPGLEGVNVQDVLESLHRRLLRLEYPT